MASRRSASRPGAGDARAAKLRHARDPIMTRFFRDRGLALVLVVLVMLLVAVSQGGLAYTVLVGELKGLLSQWLIQLSRLQWGLRACLLLGMMLLWVVKKKRALFRVIVVANVYFTMVLLVDTAVLGMVLGGLTVRAVGNLIFDVLAIAASNILIFSIWYWVIDPPGVVDGEPEGQPWAFLFPQRACVLPSYQGWVPGYADYLFLAFTTSFAFSPTDTPPLTRSAKMLMLLQAIISVVTVTGIAASAINILSSRG